MKRFKKILAVYNESVGSEAALEQSVSLARTNGAQLTVVNLLGEKPASADAVEEARKRLLRILPWIAQAGVQNVATAALVGTPYVEIIREVLREDHDLVVLSAQEGAPTVMDVFFGGTAAKLTRKCPCAVWVLKPDNTEPCGRILAAVGEMTGDPANDAINGKILDLAASLARSQNAGLHVVHAWAPSGKDAEMLASEISDQTREGILWRNEAKHRAAVNRLLARYPVVGLEHEIHLPRGMPQKSIVDLAIRLDAGLIVMGSAARTGVPRLLIGNPPETVLGAVRCGVLTVKPDDFQPPVSLPEDEVKSGPLRVAAGQG